MDLENRKGAALTTPEKPSSSNIIARGNNVKQITKVKQAIAKLDREGLSEIQKYVRERWDVIFKREQEAKAQAKFEKIKALPIGSRIVVNSSGDSSYPRGTGFVIEKFTPRGLIIAKGPKDKSYRLKPSNIKWFDIVPAEEFDVGDKSHPMIMNF